MYINPPLNDNTLALFEYSVRKVMSLGMMNETNTHAAWAALIFDYEKKSYMRSELMSKVKHDYSYYFSQDLQYSFEEEKIRENFPYLFGEDEELNLFELMSRALDAECTAQKDPRNQKRYKVSSCDRISTQEGQYIYKAQLIVDEGEDPHFTDGVSFIFLTKEAPYSCEVVEFDYANAILFFSSTRLIFVTSDCRVISDATMNTIALKKLLEELSEYTMPPGTGKSYTLAAIIMALHSMPGERTAVCCLSNVAVDQLLSKVVKNITVEEPEMKRGEFYRAGRTQDELLLRTDFLFPDDAISSKIRLMIKLYNKKLEGYRTANQQFSNEAIEIKAQLKDAREELKEHTDYLINQVKVVFSTISNFVINPRLKDGLFDNLIVDEASMLAMPQLIALARNVTKRIILVGDFQQLSPITVAGIPVLKNNVFKLCGIDINHTNHPALHPLLNQRRSNPKLVEIINKPFYGGHLMTDNPKYNSIVARPPYSECVVGMCSVTEGMVRFTKGGTRQNFANSEAVMHLLDLYNEHEEDTFSIGVITPYTGQVSLLKALFSKREYSTDFQDRVKIGTVHTFQGSESDVIIFDMVDCSKFEKGKPYFGKIYANEQGEQLLNVAISRARHKLIVVCDPEYLKTSPGGSISDRSISIFNTLLKAQWTKI